METTTTTEEAKKPATLEEHRAGLTKRLTELETSRESIDAEIRVTKNILKAFGKHAPKKES